MKNYHCQERYGLIWVCFRPEPRGEISPFPEYNDPNYQIINIPPMDWKASSGRQIESFCDIAHFAFLHSDTFSRAEDCIIPGYEVYATRAGVHADFISTVGNEPLSATSGNDEREWARIYDITLPFTTRLVIHFPEPEGGITTILNANSPITAETSRLFAILARNFDQAQPVEEVLEFQDKIYSEDRSVVERQNPERLPTDMREEVHVPADRTSIVYRQELAKLGLGHKFTS